MSDPLEPVIAAMAHHESGGDSKAVSPKGAMGLMQLMPATAKELGVTNRFDPEQSLQAGAKYLRRLYHKYEGDLDKALAAYNWGPGNVDRHGMGQLPKETREYIRKVKNTAGIQAGPEWGGETRTAETRNGPKPDFTAPKHAGMEHTTSSGQEPVDVKKDVTNAVKNWGLDAASAIPEMLGAGADMMASSELGAPPSSSGADAARTATRRAVGGAGVPEEQATGLGSVVRAANPLFLVNPESVAADVSKLATTGAKEFSAAATRGASKWAPKGQRGAVKLPGGNFDMKTVDSYTDALLIDSRIHNAPEAATYEKNYDALHRWVKTKIRNYITKELASPNDSLRKLMDEGKSHLPEHHYVDIGDEEPGQPDRWGTDNQWRARRIRSGEAPTPYADPKEIEQLKVQHGGNLEFATTPAGRKYEDLADTRMRNLSAGEIRATRERHDEELPEDFVSHAPQGMRFHSTIGGEREWMRATGADDLGLKHIVETVAEKLNNGDISPQKLDRLSLVDAAKMTHDRHAKEAAEALEQDRAMRAKQRVVQDLGNGSKLIQMKDPGEFARESDRMKHSVRGYEPPREHADWIRRSGNSGREQYGHGGWEAIKSGKAEVYSVRDAQDFPGATIELRVTPKHKSVTQIKGLENGPVTPEVQDRIMQAFNKGGHLSDVTEILANDLPMHNLIAKPEFSVGGINPPETLKDGFKALEFGLKVGGPDAQSGKYLADLQDASVKLLKVSDLRKAAEIARKRLDQAEQMLRQHAMQNPKREFLPYDAYYKHMGVLSQKAADLLDFCELVLDEGKI